ncbi:hypothetical protein [Fibrella forsythiae]|uniref:Sialate O-acetylesterase domain-containing protein n=1 Tax=Fibrella forsythiae TaxID=2817061 RepID=A0ABS3JBW2_9BACT|nr:hypothetical protein [Fibrella forsythiae]MBO0947486.1 hypothetical protein [Fibrella forsythiae]
MNHILVRNKKVGNTYAPQGVDRFYPYADNLSVEEGNALFAGDAERDRKLKEAMPGVNRLRGSQPAPGVVRFYIGRNGNGNGGGSLSTFTDGPGNGAADQTLYSRVVATGNTAAVDATAKKMVYAADGYGRDGLIPVTAKPHYAALHDPIPGGTYAVQILDASLAVLYSESIEVTANGPELAVGDSGNQIQVFAGPFTFTVTTPDEQSTSRAQRIGSGPLLFDWGGSAHTGFALFNAPDGTPEPALTASNVYFVDRVDNEAIGAAVDRVRAGGVTTYTRLAVSNVRPLVPTISGWTQFSLIYNLMNEDGPGQAVGGVYPNDQYGTVAYSRGSEYKNAYIPEWPGNKFLILIPWSHYQENRTTWRRHVMYRNQQAGIRAAGKRYGVRFHFARENVGNGDTIVTPDNVVRFNTGAIGGSGSASPRLDLLRQYVAGGSTDTNNPWYYAEMYVKKIANDFKQDIEDGVCFGINYTYTGRQEDGWPAEIGDNGALHLGDYSDGVVADFKTRMGTTSNPPAPGHYLGMDSFQGALGVKWYVYRQETYMFFKQWVSDLIHAIVPSCPIGDDYGLITGAGAVNPGVGNWKRMSAKSQIVKVNPDYYAFAGLQADLIRSNKPATAKMLIESDTNWVVDGAYTSNASAKNASEVADKINEYRLRGAAGLCFGQANNEMSFGSAKAIAQLCIQRGMQTDIVNVPTPDEAHTTNYTTTEMLTSSDNLAQGRWFDCGGIQNPVQINIVDTLPYSS